MNNYTSVNEEINKLIVFLQQQKVYEINSDELYFIFNKSPLIHKYLKNKISKSYFPTLMKRYCRVKNYKYELINSAPVVSRFYFYSN